MSSSISQRGKGYTPGDSDVWQTKTLRELDFGCVAMIRLMGGFFGSVARKGLSGEGQGNSGAGDELHGECFVGSGI